MTIKNVLKGFAIFVSIVSLSACSSWGHKSAKNQSQPGSHTSIFTANHSGRATTRATRTAAVKRTDPEAVATAYTNTTNFTELSRVASNDKCHSTKVLGGIEQHYYFVFDRSNVPAKDMASLKTEANYLHSHPNAKVRIEGNADDRGSREYNVALAARRANSVISILKQEGISRWRSEAGRMQSVSMVT